MSRQNHYRYLHRETKERLKEEVILEYVLMRRSQHSQMGSKKLYYEAKRELDMRGVALLREHGKQIIVSYRHTAPTERGSRSAGSQARMFEESESGMRHKVN